MPGSQERANAFRLANIGPSRFARLLGDWRDGQSSITEELTERVRGLVRTGALPPGARLPSERALCASLGLSRNTVSKALDELRAEGILTSRRGDGTYVATSRRVYPGRGDDRLSSFVPERGGRIDLRSAALPGLPLVADVVGTLDGARMRELVAGHGYLPAGLPELRDAIADYYSDLGLPTTPHHILVTSGAQQALRLAASMYVAPGAPVLIEEPSFRGAIESLRSLGAHLASVPSGPHGIDVDELSRTIANAKPALLVVQSTVHNPTGSVLDGLRRSRLASVTARHEVPVIDDATLADTIVEGDRRPVPLAAGGDHIITVGSVSKSFWGGLRLGWLRAHPDVVTELTSVKRGEDLGTSLLAQLAAEELLRHIEAARDERFVTLRDSRRLALEALDELLPDWTPQVPLGGGSLWARLPDDEVTATRLAQRAARNGVQILPGSTFSIHDRLEDFVRVSYAGPVEFTRRGIELLADTWSELRAGG